MDVAGDGILSEASLGSGEELSDADHADIDSLISFTNLENVLKHIINNFKALDEKTVVLDAEIRGINKELAKLNRISVLDELCADLGSKVEHLGKNFEQQKTSLIGLEGQAERSRAMCCALDKKQELCEKERVDQDRLIRDMQVVMMDKVSAAELNMLEAKFAGYSTKVEHQELVGILSQYTPVDVTEGVAAGMKLLCTRFDDYTRTAKLSQQLQELRDWVSSELLHYSKLASTQQRFQDVFDQIQEQSQHFERVNNFMEEKVRGLSDRTSSIYKEIKSELYSGLER